MTTTSILCVTQKNREKCMKDIFTHNIKKQTKKPDEIVIVTGDYDDENFEKMCKFVELETGIPVISKLFTEKDSKFFKNIGFLRNQANSLSNCEILICFDDDDIYFKGYVNYVVKMFSNNKTANVAGCTSHLIYDTDLKRYFQFGGFNQNHTVNSCMSYRKSILSTNSYSDEATSAEERFFLNDYKTPMIQLNPYEVYVQICHNFNTYDKRELILVNDIMPDERKTLHLLKSTKILDKSEIDKINNIFYVEKQIADIVFYLGLGYPRFLPSQSNLGGSEQAVLQLSKEFTKLGKSVVVYGDFENEIFDSGVTYKRFTEFSFSQKYKTLILWRLYGSFAMKYNPTADKLFLDLHDRVKLPLDKTHYERIDKVLVKSEFHKNQLMSLNKDMIPSKFTVIPNSYSKVFNEKLEVKREQFRFCYTSCYTRGLLPILAYIWPNIKNEIPNSEFHIYYGSHNISDKRFLDLLENLLSQPGVYEHGRVTLDKIREEKNKSSFNLYVSESSAEIDCISLKESCAANCIPILSNSQIFKEKPGYHVDIESGNDSSFVKASYDIVDFCKNPEKQKEVLKEMQNETASWEEIAKKWLQI